jgi:hypothetical protein
MHDTHADHYMRGVFSLQNYYNTLRDEENETGDYFTRQENFYKDVGVNSDREDDTSNGSKEKVGGRKVYTNEPHVNKKKKEKENERNFVDWNQRKRNEKMGRAGGSQLEENYENQKADDE